MIIVDTRELEERPAEVLRHIKGGETVQLVEDGIAIARITPIQRAYSPEEAQAFIDKLDRMAEEIGKYLPDHVDAVEAVREIRREL